MPLSKKRNKERMKAIRATCVQPKPVHPDSGAVQPNKPSLDDMRQLIKGIEAKPTVQPACNLPLYNPDIHKPGDRVMVKPTYGKKLIEMVIPELDAYGHPMP